MCKNNQEDVTHALYLCLKLIDFRQPIPLWNHSKLRQSSNFADTMGCIFAENRVSTLFSMDHGDMGYLEQVEQSVGQTIWLASTNIRTGGGKISGILCWVQVLNYMARRRI